MSDPMTSAEVEDILSSIRRLVSDEKRPETDTPEEPEQKPVDRLVLTPSLRVESETPDAAEAVMDSVMVEDVPSEIPLEELNATTEPLVEPVEEAAIWDEDVDDDMPVAFEFRHGTPGVVDEATVEDALIVPEDDEPEIDVLDDIATPIDAPEELAEVASTDLDPDELTRMLEEELSEIEADAFEPEVEVEPEAPDVVAEAESMPAEEAEPPETELTADAVEGDETLGATLGEKVAALEMLIANRGDTWEPDDPGTSEYAGTEEPALEWQDPDGDVDTIGESAYADYDSVVELPSQRAEAPEDDEEFDADVTAGEETLLDEAVLREMVADIVREELQGVLGERITRNVRKLVRREIQRALAAQDLE